MSKPRRKGPTIGVRFPLVVDAWVRERAAARGEAPSAVVVEIFTAATASLRAAASGASRSPAPPAPVTPLPLSNTRTTAPRTVTPIPKAKDRRDAT